MNDQDNEGPREHITSTLRMIRECEVLVSRLRRRERTRLETNERTTRFVSLNPVAGVVNMLKHGAPGARKLLTEEST